MIYLLLTLVRLLIQRFAIALPMIFAVVTLTFFLIRLAPGDPALILAGDAPTPEFLAQVRSEYGLDQPIWVQYVSYLWKAMQGDFGQSIFYGRPVFDLIWERFPATALLTVVAIVVGVDARHPARRARRAPRRAPASIPGSPLPRSSATRYRISGRHKSSFWSSRSNSISCRLVA